MAALAGRGRADGAIDRRTVVRQAVTLYLAFLAAVRVSNEQENLRVLLDDLLRQVAGRDD